MTQLEAAKKGIITGEMKKVAADERISIKELAALIARGEVIIPVNIKHKKVKPIGIGKNMKIKINANIGSSQDVCDTKLELKKLKTAVDSGADTVMDLSTGGNLKKIRKAILNASSVPIGTVPIYEIITNAAKAKKAFEKITADDIFKTIQEQAEQGVDFITVHCGVTRETVKALIAGKRILGMVSRGGTFLASWIMKNKTENPLYEYFDRLLDIAYKYDMTLSLGDGMRPGCLADATDKPQIKELKTLGEMAKRAYKRNVQVMIEGPGHVPINQIIKNMKLQKKYCNNAPFYVLGPLVTDIAPGYDHITSAIGGAIAAANGADFLCYVTPAEHLKLPDIEDVREGVIASKIAAHAADIARGIPGARDRDDEMARARRNLNWEKQAMLSINPLKAKKMRESSRPKMEDVCTMCGEFCAIKEMKCLRDKII